MNSFTFVGVIGLTRILIGRLMLLLAVMTLFAVIDDCRVRPDGYFFVLYSRPSEDFKAMKEGPTVWSINCTH